MSIANEFYTGDVEKIVSALKGRDTTQLSDPAVVVGKADMGRFFFEEADCLIQAVKESTDFKIGKFEAAWNLQLVGDPKLTSTFAVSLKDGFVQAMAKLTRAQLHDVAYHWRKSVKDENLFGRQAFNMGWGFTSAAACLLVGWGLSKLLHPMLGIVWSGVGLFFVFRYYGPGFVTTEYVLGSVEDFEKILKNLQRVCLAAQAQKSDVIYYCSQ